MTSSLKDYFEGLYGASPDPYGTQARWYEQRKRDILLASLPRPRFRSAYEPGCGTGELSLQLAARCDRLLAADFSAQALHTARARPHWPAHVELARHALPHDWPLDQRFDLVVLSEVGYFLSLAAVQAIARHCAATLDDDGVLVACDWLPDFAERATATQEVHAALAAIGLAPLATHVEDDFQLKVWARDPRSVAQREGIR